MKIFAVLIITAIAMNRALACSEAGPIELKLSPIAEKSCSKDAKIFATDFAKTIKAVHKNKTNINVLNAKSITAKEPKLYTVKKRMSSGMIGYNVTVNYDKQTECTFCVNMAIQDGYCTIETIEKFMCNFKIKYIVFS